MSLFEWKPEYSVGYDEIDDQHKQLFQMADNLHCAMMEGRGRESLIGLFSRLVTYTRQHFASEERIMRDTGYPGYLQHHMEHEKLTGNVLALQKKVVTGNATITHETLVFLSDWLSHHIKISDQKVARHAKSPAATTTH